MSTPKSTKGNILQQFANAYADGKGEQFLSVRGGELAEAYAQAGNQAAAAEVTRESFEAVYGRQ